ncbi:MAG: helix-turn-helix domain-containing protein [Burkholderiales bacterium]|nr:helix-turn-helix domain-containing protein [Burkholderiales bacterium]
MTSSSHDLGGSAGLMIRQAREAQGIEIDTLASIIKVPAAKLQALESDDRAVLPDANFNRALAMTVCRALKIDPSPVLALMPAAVAVALASNKPPLNQPFRDFSHTGLTFEDSTSLSLKVPKLTPAVLAPVVLLLLAGGIYLLPEHLDMGSWFRSSSVVASKPAEPAASVATEASGVEMAASVVVPLVDAASEPASEPVTVASAPEQKGVAASSVQAGASQARPTAAADVRVAAATSSALGGATAAATSVAASSPLKLVTRASEPQAVAAGASAASSTVVSASAPTGPVGKLTLSSKEPAWIEVRDALGQRVFSRQLAAGERVDVQGQAPLKVHAGNAPSVSIQFNGRSVDLAAVTRQNVARIELK